VTYYLRTCCERVEAMRANEAQLEPLWHMPRISRPIRSTPTGIVALVDALVNEAVDYGETEPTAQQLDDWLTNGGEE
jgi:hypothetical protein